MDKILTIEELFKQYSNLYHFEEGDAEYLVDKEDFKEAVLQFAKTHVQLALESAYNNAYIIEVKKVQEYDYADSSNYGVSKESILNCYPLENIE